MTIDRLSHLQATIEGYYRTLDSQEKALRLDLDLGHEAIHAEKISLTKETIAKYEREYISLLPSQIDLVNISKVEANELTSILSQEITQLKIQPEIQNNTELLNRLDEIMVELRKPEPPVSLKLKTGIPLLLSGEVELDIGSLVRWAFPIFSKLAGKLKKTQA
jgi:hypothetical protein